MVHPVVFLFFKAFVSNVSLIVPAVLSNYTKMSFFRELIHFGDNIYKLFEKDEKCSDKKLKTAFKMPDGSKVVHCFTSTATVKVGA